MLRPLKRFKNKLASLKQQLLNPMKASMLGCIEGAKVNVKTRASRYHCPSCRTCTHRADHPASRMLLDPLASGLRRKDEKEVVCFDLPSRHPLLSTVAK